MRISSLFFCFLFFSTNGFSQQTATYNDIISSYSSYAELPREVVYVHTNKTTYIKGEQIGFTAYVLDKGVKKKSLETKNLYISIADSTNTIIKQKLLKVEQGAAIGNFVLDSLFTSGEYIVKAYTNWMKNFKEQNFYVQPITILDPSNDKGSSERKIVDAQIDAQFLPEGGHLLLNAANVVGVVIKDNLGFGIPELEGELKDDEDNVVSKFSVNHVGLGKFNFTPEENKNYKAVIFFNGQNFTFPLAQAESAGVLMQVTNEYGDAKLSLSTNEVSLSQIKTNTFYLAVHNGSEARVIKLPSFENLKVQQHIPQDLLYPGINIFTVFDAKNTPILERLYFNYNGVSLDSLSSVDTTKEGDSLEVQMKYKALDSLSHVSISILPSATVSYQPHHSISSYTLLQPYVRGPIENGRYYFQKKNKDVKKDLDLLLLTQGWSSYDWNTIFNDPPEYSYDFENGIGYTGTKTEKEEKEFILYSFLGLKVDAISLPLNEAKFQRNGLFPYEGQQVQIGEVARKGRVRKAELELEFKPSKIPDLDAPSVFMGYKENTIIRASNNETLQLLPAQDVQKLDEVVVTETIKDAKLEQLRVFSFGKVEKIEEKERRVFRTFTNYIQSRGLEVFDNLTQGLVIINRRQGLPAVPLIYLDGSVLNPPAGANSSPGSLDVLRNLLLEQIGYIEVNKTGIGEGFNGAGGVIRIHTREDYSSGRLRGFRPIYSEFEIPLTFSKPSKYYVPRYSSYSSDFYEYYGVVGWFPRLRSDENGSITFKVSDTGLSELTLFIEGITKDGSFISEQHMVLTN